MKNPLHPYSHFGDGRIACISSQDFSINSASFDPFTVWEPISANGVENIFSSPFESNELRRYFIYRLSPLVASILTQNWKFCAKLLNNEETALFDESDFLVNRFTMLHLQIKIISILILQ